MYILGIESSCDETSAAVVKASDGAEGPGRLTVLSDIVASQIETHRLYGGVVPEIAGRAHIEAITGTVRSALDGAGLSPHDLDGVAVTSHPGLIGALLVGVNFAKSFAYANSLPLMPINHIRAHTAAAYLCDPCPKPPFLSLVVSGGHTSFYIVHSYTDYEEIGSTRDDAAGEAFDKLGRVIGLPYPGGAAMDALAHEGDASGGARAITLPSPAIPGDNLDFSFSGLKTAGLNYLHSLEQRGETPDRAAFASAFTSTVVGAISKKVNTALDMTGCVSLVLAGGVAANSHIRAALADICRRRGVVFTVPPVSLCGDNAAMVGAQGVYEYIARNFATTALNASPAD